MVKVHAGSWLGLPDFGITEMLSGSRTGQGGSDLIPNLTSPSNNYAYNPTQNASLNPNLNANQYVNMLGGSVQGANTGPTAQQKTTPPAPVTNNNNGRGGGGGGGSPPAGSSGGIQTNEDAIRAGYTGLNDYNDQMARRSQQGGNSDMNAQIDSLYNEGIGMYDKQAAGLGDALSADTANLTSDIQNQQGKAQTEQSQLLGDTQTSQDSYMNTIKSALSEAFSAFNALQQQGLSKFGTGSSAGAAISDIARQQFLKNQGKINQTQAQGLQQFETEKSKIKTYISQKLTDLDQYKSEALASLKSNYQNNLNQILSQKNALAGQKAQQKMQLMSQTMNYAQTIAAQDLAFRQSLASSAINHMQTIAGRSFTPTEIQTTAAELMGNNIVPQYSSQQLQASAASPNYNPNAYKQSNQDPYAQTNPYQSSTTAPEANTNQNQTSYGPTLYNNRGNSGLYIG